MHVREEQSGDGETGHVAETLGVVAFQDGLIPCFTADTLIQTPAGLRVIEKQQAGNAVSVRDPLGTGAYDARILVKIIRQTIGPAELSGNPKLLPLKTTAGALRNGLPQRDFVVSRQHRLLVSSGIAERMFGTREVLVAAIRLTELPGIYVGESVRSIECFHLLFERHQIFFAESASTKKLLCRTPNAQSTSAGIPGRYPCDLSGDRITVRLPNTGPPDPFGAESEAPDPQAQKNAR